MYIFLHVCTYACMHVHMYACISLMFYIHVCVCVCGGERLLVTSVCFPSITQITLTDVFEGQVGQVPVWLGYGLHYVPKQCVTMIVCPHVSLHA
jgi:hypothetical protein